MENQKIFLQPPYQLMMILQACTVQQLKGLQPFSKVSCFDKICFCPLLFLLSFSVEFCWWQWFSHVDILYFSIFQSPARFTKRGTREIDSMHLLKEGQLKKPYQLLEVNNNRRCQESGKRQNLCGHQEVLSFCVVCKDHTWDC